VRSLGIRTFFPSTAYLVVDRRANVPGESTSQSVSTMLRLVEGETVEVWASQKSPIPLFLDANAPASNVTMQYVSR
jgi:hypothetical protein